MEDRVQTINVRMLALFKHRGAKSRLAEELGLTRQTVNLWAKDGVPARWRASPQLEWAIARLMQRLELDLTLTRWRKPETASADTSH